jgi:hypothetical protein
LPLWCRKSERLKIGWSNRFGIHLPYVLLHPQIRRLHLEVRLYQGILQRDGALQPE